MATYPTLTLTDLVAFSGRTSASYTNAAYAASVIPMATILFKVATGLKDNGSWPDQEPEASLAKNAILELADQLYLTQPYKAVVANPFNSETIGSYSYSKSMKSGRGANTGAANVTEIWNTAGLIWFDLARQILTVSSDFMQVKSEALHVFTDELTWTLNPDGSIKVQGPNDINMVDLTMMSISVPMSYDPN